MPAAVKAVPPAGKTGKSDPELKWLPGLPVFCWANAPFGVTNEENGEPVLLCKVSCGVTPQLEFRPTGYT